PPPPRPSLFPYTTLFLSPAAAPFQPFVADETMMKEFTVKAVLIGAVFGIIFGAATVYLALKAGLTVSASIPIAVLAISLLRKLRSEEHTSELQSLTNIRC